jgi:ribosomal protein L16 Arg81 hydroxylase
MSQPLVEQEFEVGTATESEFLEMLTEGAELRRHENARVVVHGVGGARQVFLNGKPEECGSEELGLMQCLVGKHLVSADIVQAVMQSPEQFQRLHRWYLSGLFYLTEEFADEEE